MPTLDISNFNIVCATLGGFVTVFGLVSYLCKEKFYLSEALISTIAGIVFGPNAANFLRPNEYALGSEETMRTINLYFTRLVLGVQLVLAGVQLPSKYLQKQWKPLALLLGPGMTGMWLITSLLCWAMVPNLSFLGALAVGACVTPTDPVLSNSIVKGKFADKNIPKELAKLIIAESGANDGLGYPFLFLPLYLIKYTQDGGVRGGARTAMGLWFGETWGYTIIMSVAYGATVGWIAKELLHWAEERKYVDRESFLVFAITLALFIVGTDGMLGSDDVLACFVAGNAFTWDDWFRLETMDDSLQPTIDMLLNVAIFIWIGAVCPWHMFAVNSVIPTVRLVFLGVLVLLLRRLPVILALHKKIPQIEAFRQAAFTGFFGPIGVSAVFYLYVSLEFLSEIKVNGHIREDAEQLSEVMMVVIWFLIICSIVVHGLSIPVGKLGILIPRTLSQAVSSEADPSEPANPFSIRSLTDASIHTYFRGSNAANPRQSDASTPRTESTATGSNLLPRPIYRIGGSVMNKNLQRQQQRRKSRSSLPDAPLPHVQGGVDEAEQMPSNAQSMAPSRLSVNEEGEPTLAERTIRFADGSERRAGGTANAERDG
ncbi:Sodium/hydrogen exchanger family-domain-containing protein [Phyllosticta citribraziliensis]|uniref:Sodium/hydrogen exchanger family-domain-containing protein n=1 Tax=Phyllosticta citribraziliensis TaxID=989973 RepID=A0ABR1LXD8_9PEZI